MQAEQQDYVDPKDLIITQELPVVEARLATQTSPEFEIKKAQTMIDLMLSALGGGKTYRNEFWVSDKSSLANYWWFLVGLGFARKKDEINGETEFSVTSQGVAHLKAIGALVK